MRSNFTLFSGVKLKNGTRAYFLCVIIAIELVLSFSPLAYLNFGNAFDVNRTFLDAYVVIAAMLSGPLGGGIAGAVFGLTSAWSSGLLHRHATYIFFSPFESGNFFGSIVLAVGTRAVFGIFAGFLFYCIFRLLEEKYHRIAISAATILSLSFHRTAVLFMLWWFFPAAGISAKTALTLDLSIFVLAKWFFAVLFCLAVYYFFRHYAVIGIISEHEKYIEGIHATFHRTAGIIAAGFLIFSTSLFFFGMAQCVVILRHYGIDPSQAIVEDIEQLAVQIAVSFGAIVVILSSIMFWKQQKYALRHLKNEEKLRETREQHQQEQIELVGVMSSIYFGTYYIDLPQALNAKKETDETTENPFSALLNFDKKEKKAADSQENVEYSCRYRAIKQEDFLKEFIPEEGDYEKFVETVCSGDYFDQPTKDKLAAYLDCRTMAARIDAGGGNLMKEFQHQELGWCRLGLIVAGRDENGNVKRVLLTMRAIEEFKRNEMEMHEALASALDIATSANAAKSDFLARMSHDIRTPMNAILGMTTIAGTHLGDKERVADCLKKINISGRHLLGLINEILDMSKIESGHMELGEEAFSLPELIDNLLAMVRPQADEKKHTLQVSLQDFHNELVIGDNQRIQQVFMNLVSNAIRFTPDGGDIKITVREKPSSRFGIGCYEFVFEDNGYGMSEESLAHIFEPFSRAKDDRVARLQGTGLGLAIAKNIVRLMDGDIRVESEIDKGTKFTVTISLRLQAGDETKLPEEFRDFSVLVVEEDAETAKSIVEALTQLGMQSDCAKAGKDALEKAVAHHQQKSDFRAIILDWRLSDTNAGDVMRQLRRQLGGDTPQIIVADYDWSLIEQEAREAGAKFFVSKPLFKSRLQHLFTRIMGKKEEETENVGMSEITSADYAGCRALLVEDNELNAEIAAEILGMTGLIVDFAQDGKEALDIMSKTADDYYDIVFMDIQMPFMDGYEATRAIRALPREYTKRVPIVAMSANAFAEDIAEARNSGMNEHIAKPIDCALLAKTLDRWLNNKNKD